MKWLIDETGGVHRWSNVYRIYPSADNREVVIETGDYRNCICRTSDARATIRRILELEERTGNLNVAALGGE